MFKIILKVLCSLILMVGTLSASEIGIIDTAVIFQKAKFVQISKENFSEKEKEFNELLEKKTAKIEEAVSKGKSEEDIQEMIKERDEELNPKKEELMQYQMSFEQNFLLNVTGTAKRIAEEYGIDVVLDKNVVYYGGFDLTDLVLEKLNQ